MADIYNHYFRVILKNAERQGVDPEVMMADLNLSPAFWLDQESLLSASQVCKLYWYLRRALGDEFLGLAATPSKLGTFAMVCKLVYQSTNLARLFKDVQKAYALTESDLNIELHSIGQGELALEMQRGDDSFDIEHLCAESWLLSWHRFACWLTNIKTKPLRAEFAFSVPAHVAEYEKLFQCPLYFNQSRTALILKEDFAKQHPIRTREELYRFLRQMPNDLLTIPGNETSLESKIRLMLQDNCEHYLQFPRFDDLAKGLYMSPKTLQRKLRREGASYKRIKDSMRQDLVVEHLKNSALSIKEIAYKAGFDNAASLSRKFVHWTGMPPSTYRKEIIGYRSSSGLFTLRVP